MAAAVAAVAGATAQSPTTDLAFAPLALVFVPFLLLVSVRTGVVVGLGVLPLVIAGVAGSASAPTILLYTTVLTICGGYVGAVWLLRRSRRQHPQGSAGETAVYVAVLGLGAPGVAVVALEVLVQRSDVVLDPPSLGLRLGVAAVAMVPVLISVARGNHRGHGWQVHVSAVALAVVGAALGVRAAATQDLGVTVLTGAVLVLSALVAGRFAAGLTASATLLGATVGQAGQPLPNWLLASLLCFAALGLLLSAVRTMSVLAIAAEALPTAGVELQGVERYRARISRAMRVVRWSGAALVVVWMFDTEGVQASLPPWAAVLVLGGGLVAVNTLSHAWDATWGESPRRQQYEIAADAAVLLTSCVVLFPVAPYQGIPIELIVLVVVIGLRLPARLAVGGAVAASAVVLGARFANDVLPWATVPPDHRAVTEVYLLVLLPVVAYLVSMAVGELHRLHGRAAAVAKELDESQATVLQQQAVLNAENAVIRHQRAELRTRIDELDEANRQLTASRAQLESFSSVVAHDLRSPIATGLMISKTLPSLPEDVRPEMFERLKGSLDRAATLIETLHEQARTARAELAVTSVDLNHVVRAVLDDLSSRIEVQGAVVRQPVLLPRVNADPVLLHQVLLNLVSNGLRHGAAADGTVTMAITATWGDDGVTVTVADDGPGLPAGGLDLFAPGVRGVRNIDGLGLGLATCHRVVGQHGGRIWSHPSPLGGAAFSFTLPAPRPTGLRVLVVEDDPVARLLFAHTIREAADDMDVVEVATIAEAVDHLSGGTIDAVILDHRLPDGLSEDLLAHTARHAIPVHIVTADDVEGAFAAHRRMGAIVTTKSDVFADPSRLATSLLGSVAPAGVA